MLCRTIPHLRCIDEQRSWTHAQHDARSSRPCALRLSSWREERLSRERYLFAHTATRATTGHFEGFQASSCGVHRKKRRRHNRLGWAVQWGTVRMLGTFLEDPIDVPRVVVDYAAEQLGIDDPSCIEEHAERVPTPYEHSREIRDLLELEVPDGKRVSTLECMRTPVVKLTGTGQVEALDRTSYVLGFGTGAIDLSAVAPVKPAELASYGMKAKAARIKNLRGERRVATLVTTVRELKRATRRTRAP
ncbi:DUF4158 domain-containing protein [Nonomuraea sp. JJY05]|uniref:DUF4158 domain-containing protein n=1 Tax=Nonomuraea sp. JJY05 TaxID=3350255 RepID=UPI00373F7343